jgi:hypothetical protein
MISLIWACHQLSMFTHVYEVREFIGVNKKYSNSIMNLLSQVPFLIISVHNISFNT